MKKILALMVAGVATMSSAAYAADPQPTLTICSGTQGGKYFTVGQKIKAQLDRLGWNVTVLETEGSQDNVAKMTGSKVCDAGIIQEDVPSQAEAAMLRPISVLYAEPVLMVCNDGTDDIDDLTPAHTVHVGSLAGGTAVSMNRIMTLVYPNDKKRPKLVEGSLSEDLGMMATMPNKTCYASVMAFDSAVVQAAGTKLDKKKWAWVDTYDSALKDQTGINGGTLYTESNFKINTPLDYDNGEFAQVNALFVVTQAWNNAASPTTKRQLGGLSMIKF